MNVSLTSQPFCLFSPQICRLSRQAQSLFLQAEQVDQAAAVMQVPKIGQKYGSMDSGFDDSKVLDDSKVISNGTNFDNPKFYADACIFAGHVFNFCGKSYL